MNEPRKPRWLEEAEKALRARSMDDILNERDETPGYSISPSKLAPLLLAYNEVLGVGLDPIGVFRAVAAPHTAPSTHRGGGRPTTRGSPEECLKLYPLLRVLAALAPVARQTRKLMEPERERRAMRAAQKVVSDLREKHPVLDLSWLPDEKLLEHIRWMAKESDVAWAEERLFSERQAAIARINALGDEWMPLPDRDQHARKRAWRQVEEAFRTHPYIRQPAKKRRAKVLPGAPRPKRYMRWETDKALREAGEAERKKKEAAIKWAKRNAQRKLAEAEARGARRISRRPPGDR